MPLRYGHAKRVFLASIAVEASRAPSQGSANQRQWRLMRRRYRLDGRTDARFHRFHKSTIVLQLFSGLRSAESELRSTPQQDHSRQDRSREVAAPVLQSSAARPEPAPMRSLAGGPIAVRPKEAARLAGISRSTVFRAIQDGELPARKYGSCTLILVQDLWTWLERLPGSGAKRCELTQMAMDAAE
jgi:excisionase family DNA binding protein